MTRLSLQMPPTLRIDPVAVTAPDSDVHSAHDDPRRLLKLSHSLRYQLLQPRREAPKQQQQQGAQEQTLTPHDTSSPHVPSQQPHSSLSLQPDRPAFILQPPSPTLISPHLSPYSESTHPLLVRGRHSPQQPPFPPSQLSPQHLLQPPSPKSPNQTKTTSPQLPRSKTPTTPLSPHRLPPLKGPGTRSGPSTGFASHSWLQDEVRRDVDDLRRHVDDYVTLREHRTFDLERSALKAEIEHLRRRLVESEARAARFQSMLPDDNGEFGALKARMERLEKEATMFGGLYEKEAKATKAALQGYREALAHLSDIEGDFEALRRLVAAIPQHVAQQQQLVAGNGYGVMTAAAAAGGPATTGRVQSVWEPPRGTPRGCCGCINWPRRTGKK